MIIGNYYDNRISCLVNCISQKMYSSDSHWPCILETNNWQLIWYTEHLNSSVLFHSWILVKRYVFPVKMWNFEREWILFKLLSSLESFIQDPIEPLSGVLWEHFSLKTLWPRERELIHNSVLTAHFEHKSCYIQIRG